MNAPDPRALIPVPLAPGPQAPENQAFALNPDQAQALGQVEDFLGDSTLDGSVALSDFCQKMALILLNNFCWELLNATEPKQPSCPLGGRTNIATALHTTDQPREFWRFTSR